MGEVHGVLFGKSVIKLLTGMSRRKRNKFLQYIFDYMVYGMEPENLTRGDSELWLLIDGLLNREGGKNNGAESI
jgi:hypothetical protein